jgi:hypothetical protein
MPAIVWRMSREGEGGRSAAGEALVGRALFAVDWLVDCIVASRPPTWVGRYRVSRTNTQSEERLDRVSVHLNGAGVPHKPNRTAPKIGLQPAGSPARLPGSFALAFFLRRAGAKLSSSAWVLAGDGLLRKFRAIAS